MNSGRTIALGLVGAVLGGGLGYLLFGWLAGQGFYALMIPPIALGYGAGLLARDRCLPLAIICAVTGLALGLFTEWRFAPFSADESLGYFLTHLHQLRPLTGIFIALGSFFAFRSALGSGRIAPTNRSKPQ